MKCIFAKQLYVGVVISLLFVSSAFAHKMVVLISTPRSLSTGTLRMMESRGDFVVFNEPAIAIFHKKHAEHSSLKFSGDIPTYENIVDRLKTAWQSGNVFIKEMFFAAREYLFDENFVKSPDCYFVFLVRNPHHAAVSEFKKVLQAVEQHDEIWYLKRQIPDYFSYASVYALYEQVHRCGVNKPYIIISEELAAHPHEVLECLCSHVGIPMLEASLSWKSLDENFEPAKAWNDPTKTKAGAQLWHDRALKSTGFEVLTSYKVDAENNPTFEEIVDLELRGARRWEYYYNLMYYQKFCALAANHG